MLRLLRSVHAWAGAFLSMLLAVLGLSGALLVLKKDYLRLVIPEARAQVALTPEQVGAALEAVEAQFERDTLRYVSMAEPGFALHKVVFRNGSAAYADQSGAIVAEWGKNGRPEEWLFDLHHYLLMGDTGKIIAGLAGLAAVLMVVTGLIIVVPALRSFAWRLWPASSRRRDLLAHHRDLGVIFALPVAIFALTGSAIVFHKPTKSIIAAATFSQPTSFERPSAGNGDVDWPQALANAYREAPQASPRIVSWPAAADAPASVRLRQPMEWHQNGRTYVYVDPATSRAVGVNDAQKLSRGERAYNAIYPIHSAGVGGRLYDLFSIFSGVALTALGCVGVWTFAVRQRRGLLRKRENRKSASRNI